MHPVAIDSYKGSIVEFAFFMSMLLENAGEDSNPSPGIRKLLQEMKSEISLARFRLGNFAPVELNDGFLSHMLPEGSKLFTVVGRPFPKPSFDPEFLMVFRMLTATYGLTAFVAVTEDTEHGDLSLFFMHVVYNGVDQ
jgi:hypothetical protein